ncbi:MAG: PQQ-dependent sugar dehydrogenase, partial [Verrucomicrobiota bacterium]
VGPDLQAAGDKFSREDLIRSILEPSASIMMGYAATIVETTSDETLAGIVRSSTDTHLVLATADGSRKTINRSDIRSRKTHPFSLMPPGLHAGLTVEEFTDLIVYLESLKQPAQRVANEAGTPLEIGKTDQPVTLVPVNRKEHGFHKPVWFGEHPVLDEAFIIAEKSNASLWLLEKQGAEETKKLFVNILDEVHVTADEGLLGVAFHPDFPMNRKYYFMHEEMVGEQRRMVIGERVARADLRADSGRPTRRVFTYDVGTIVHHGGGLEFGPDGYLYIGMGDGGPQGDPQGHAQDPNFPAGKLFRLDVNRRDPGKEYAIPSDNPFVREEAERMAEVFAYGLRQPWRFSFDPANGDLWVADVGQNRFEEICIVRAGENHGWNVFEGFELYSTAYRKDDAKYVPPVVSFRRRHGASVTGGYVYRARPDSPFHGVYICGDYETKRLWGITQNDRKLETIFEIGQSPDRIVSFGQDREGEIYFIGYDTGVVYRIDFEGATFPK